MKAEPPIPPVDTAKPDFWERRAFEKQLINVIPDIRAIARVMTRDRSAADDLVQDTIVRALRAYESFQLGSNMKAWVLTILHNCHINSVRRRRTYPIGDLIDDWVQAAPNQEDRVELKDVLRALNTLAPAHREAIMLVRASGVSYADAASIMSCKLGTVKSRVNRADTALRAALGTEYAVSAARVEDHSDQFSPGESNS